MTRWCSAHPDNRHEQANDLRIGFGQLKNAHISPRAKSRTWWPRSAYIPSDNHSTGASEYRRYGTFRVLVKRAMRRLSTMTRQFSSSTTSRGFSVNTRLNRRRDRRSCTINWRRGDARPIQLRRPVHEQRRTHRCDGGAAFADFLLGHFNNAESQVGAPIADFRSNYTRSTSRTTGERRRTYHRFGLRWEYDQPFTDKETRSSTSITRGQLLRTGLRADGHRRSV